MQTNNIFDGFLEDDSSSESSTEEKKYMEPTVLDSINLEKYFRKQDIEFAKLRGKNLKITDKGLYSISKYYDAQWITNIITNFLNYNGINTFNAKIIDGTAGIGGNTISFSRYFGNVHAVEINDVHHNVLKNNLDALMINNVTTYKDNFLNIIDKLSSKTNIFFFDPPWGGKSYKNFKYFNLKVGKLPLYSVINLLYDNNYKYVIIKAPYNLNISVVHTNVKYENMNIYNSAKKNMILIIFYN